MNFFHFYYYKCNSSLDRILFQSHTKGQFTWHQELDPGTSSNYLPIPNFHFLSKMLEKCISLHLVDYLDTK